MSRTMDATRVDLTIHHHDPTHPGTKGVLHASFGVDHGVDGSTLSVDLENHFVEDFVPGDMYKRLVPNKLHDVTFVGKKIRFMDPVKAEFDAGDRAIAMEVRCIGDYGMVLVCPKCERLTEVRAEGHVAVAGERDWPTLGEILLASVQHREDYHS